MLNNIFINPKFNRISKFLKTFSVAFLFLLVFFGSVPTFAATCTGSVDVGIQDVFNPGSFIPVVPSECSGALKLDSAPYILARAYGFMASLAFYIASFMVVVYGIQWIVGGAVDEQAEQAKKNFKRAVWAIIITLTISLIILQALDLMGANITEIEQSAS